jgi:hypothetical protein
MSVKGFPISVRKNDGSTGNDESLAFANVLPLSNSLYGLAGMNFGVYRVTEDAVVASGSTQNILNITAHGAKKHDIIRFKDASFAEHEVSIKRIIDANSVEIYGSLEAAPSASDLVDILRPVLPRFTDTGATLATVQSGPVTIKVDGVDTVISVDTITPSNTVPLPVQLYGVNGTLNITADDLDVQLTHTGATPDSVQIGDGTTLMGITASNEAKVSDADALIALQALFDSIGDRALPDADSLLGLTNSALSELQTIVNAFTGVYDPVNDPLLVNTVLDFIYKEIEFIEADTTAIAAGIGAITDLAVTNPASNSTVISALKGLLTINAAMSAKLPATLGQAAEAASLSVALATEQDALLGNISTRSTNIDGSIDNLEVINAAIQTAIGAQADAAENDPLATASLIAITKGVLSEVVDISDQLPTTLGQKVKSQSLSVTLASDQENLGTEEEPGNGGTYATTTLSTATAATLGAPAGAIGFVLSNDVESADSIRYRVGATATAAAGGGMALLPGASTAFIPCAANVSVIEVSGTCYANIQWVTRI